MNLVPSRRDSGPIDHPWPPPHGYRDFLEESIERDPLVAGELTIDRVSTLISGLPGHLRSHAEALMSRHGYGHVGSGEGPHANVLGHPLLHLPIWVDAASDGKVDEPIMTDILESSLCGYLAVRAEDDYFDGHWDHPKAAMMLSTFFRSRHQALLANHIGDRRFWVRFEELWRGYADAMLHESELTDISSEYGPEDFDRVLARSQPLEIPANAVLAVKGLWDRASRVGELVGRLTKATQLFDDFVDAPEDLAAGNYTPMVRRLGGAEGEQVLRRNMVVSCDAVFEEIYEELDQAVATGTALGLTEIEDWVETRKTEIDLASKRMYRALFERLGSLIDPDASPDA